MKPSAERMIIMLVIASFAFTSINTFVTLGNPITREEAIEISRNTHLIRSLLEHADYYTFVVHFLNETRGIWHVTWYIHLIDTPSGFRAVAGHTIDAETGQILGEGTMAAR